MKNQLMKNSEVSTNDLRGMLGELMAIQKNQMDSDQLVRARLTKNEQIIQALSIEVSNVQSRIYTAEEQIENLKLNEEITDEQVTTIQARAKKRVSEILDYPNGDSIKYYRTFISNLYSVLRDKYNLGSKTARTKKKNYDNVIAGIDAWAPDIKKLKEKVDNRGK